MGQASGSIEICTRHLLQSLATAITQIGKCKAPPKRAFKTLGQHAPATRGTVSVSNFNLIIIIVLAVFASLAGIRSAPVDQMRLPVIVLSYITSSRIFILWLSSCLMGALAAQLHHLYRLARKAESIFAQHIGFCL